MLQFSEKDGITCVLLLLPIGKVPGVVGGPSFSSYLGRDVYTLDVESP